MIIANMYSNPSYWADEVAQTSRLHEYRRSWYSPISALVQIDSLLAILEDRFCGAFIFLLSGCVSYTYKTTQCGSDDGSKDNINALRLISSLLHVLHGSAQCSFFPSFDV
jgi:hypothetical protein